MATVVVNAIILHVRCSEFKTICVSDLYKISKTAVLN